MQPIKSGSAAGLAASSLVLWRGLDGGAAGVVAVSTELAETGPAVAIRSGGKDRETQAAELPLD